VERKNTIPILANVLLEAKGDQVKFLATESRGGAAERVPGRRGKERLAHVAREETVRDRQVAARHRDPDLRKRRAASRSRRIGSTRGCRPCRGEDFPTLPEAGNLSSESLSRAALKEMVAKTHFAITARHEVFSERRASGPASGLDEPGRTDGHRLALVTTKREGKATNGAEESRPILPKKTLGELARLLTEGEGDVRFERGENHLFFDVGGRMLISRMIDGQFPAYERVIPKGNGQAHRVRARPADERRQARGAPVE